MYTCKMCTKVHCCCCSDKFPLLLPLPRNVKRNFGVFFIQLTFYPGTPVFPLDVFVRTIPLSNCDREKPEHSQISFQIVSKMGSFDKKAQFILPNDTGICLLECKTAFSGLTKKEKSYSHYLSQASWYGSLICLYQVSHRPERTSQVKNRLPNKFQGLIDCSNFGFTAFQM